MNAQELEYVRLELTRALFDESGGTKGQLEAFSEHPPANKIHYPRQPIYKVELEGERWVNADKAAVYVLETRSRRRPLPPIKEHTFASCSWRRAILALEEYQAAWLRYCYSFDLHFNYQTAICQHVWESYQTYKVGNRLQSKIIKRLISLVWLAVQDTAAKNRNETYREYASNVLANLMNVDRSTWSRVYAKHWSQLKEVAGRMDVEALHMVAVRREEIIFRTELQNATN
ncbi:MAG: antitermination protein [Serratia symbiotica]|nr:antitermination protein [Serratia symbiotica]